MHCQNNVEHFVVHVGKCLITENTSIVDEHVDATKVINSSLHYSIAIFNRCLRRNGLGAQSSQFADYGVRVDKIINNNLGSEFREKMAISPTKTSATTSHENDFT